MNFKLRHYRGALAVEVVGGRVDCGVEGCGIGEGLMGEVVRLEVALGEFDIVNVPPGA